MAISPREAFFAAQDKMLLERTVGRIAAESLAVYPPGIPNVLAGEVLTAEVVAYLTEARERGSVVRGASDRTLATIRVVAEESGGGLTTRSASESTQPTMTGR